MSNDPLLSVNRFKSLLRPLKRKLSPDRAPQRAIITEPTGKLDPTQGPATLVMVVGPGFKQHIPNAMMTARMGYCHAFEDLGIPYIITDTADLKKVLHRVPDPFCFIVGHEYVLPSMDRQTIRLLSRIPHAVWVNPWFENSDRFFDSHQLDASIWAYSEQQRRKILDSRPNFVFTATAPRGMDFFSLWERHGLPAVSMPLACDLSVYENSPPYMDEFDDVRMAFVGGYWPSKAQQIDPYLRPFEKDLTIYGYSKWPYSGYRGMLPRDAEASLYHQAILSPTINEPTVALLHGQINERVFKILGAGGCTVVDAIPAYRDFFKADELLLPESISQFTEMCQWMLNDRKARDEWAQRGKAAVLARHTYHHRARQMLHRLGMSHLVLQDTDSAFPLYRKAS
jgi:hypothetical protein